MRRGFIVMSAALILGRCRRKVLVCDNGKPRNWAPIFSVYMAASSATIVLPFTSTAFVAGKRTGTIGGDLVAPTGRRQKLTLAPTFNPLTLPAPGGCLSRPALVGANQMLTVPGFSGAALGASALLLTS
mgnify:CR=1 FL=1